MVFSVVGILGVWSRYGCVVEVSFLGLLLWCYWCWFFPLSGGVIAVVGLVW